MYAALIILQISVIVTSAQSSLLEQLNYFASQSQYAAQVYSHLQVPFSMDTVMSTSLDLALQTCQNTFKWQRWNCPSTDYFLRRTSKTLVTDREDAYVNAISMAAVLYTITKNCSSGIIAGCAGSCLENPYSSQCSDNPQKAEELYRTHMDSATFSQNFHGKISEHNYLAIKKLLQKSLVKQCGCAIMDVNGICLKELCMEVLKPFEEIAKDVHQMYEESLELSDTPENSRIMWDNVPMDVLVYMKESPNYCEPDAVPNWNGMRGRQCATGENGNDQLTDEERTRCLHLCRACGYTVRPQNVVTEMRCNCKFTWGFQVQCDTCVTVQRQYYCY